MTQKNMILEYLKKYGSITPLEAMREFGCMRLSAQIFKLKHNDGYDIETTMESSKNRFGADTCYAKYTLKQIEGVQNAVSE